MSHAHPYVPLGARTPESGSPGNLKPWQQHGDTIDNRGRSTLYHLCYKCGHHEDDLAALNAHEDQCRREEP